MEVSVTVCAGRRVMGKVAPSSLLVLVDRNPMSADCQPLTLKAIEDLRGQALGTNTEQQKDLAECENPVTAHSW